MLLACIISVLLGNTDVPDTNKTTYTGKKVYVNNIVLIGNKVTKNDILYREIPFVVGDSISDSTFAKHLRHAQQNLMNTALFNFVRVDFLPLSNDRVDVYVNVIERWYIWPSVTFELADRNFNQWYKARDFRRVYYGAYMTWNNFRGKKEVLQLRLKLGYAHQFGLAYTIPYINKKQKSGLMMSYSYTQSREIGYASDDNTLLFFRDSTVFPRIETHAKLRYTYRQGIYNSYLAELKFNQASISDTLSKLSKDYLSDGLKKQAFFWLSVNARRDRRDYKPYALRGYLLSFDVHIYGLGLLESGKNTVTTTELSAKKFTKLTSRWYVAASAKTKISLSNDQPYYIQRGMGYADFIRGYEYYVIDGQHYGLAKAGIKYELLKPKTMVLNFIPSTKFNTLFLAVYLNAFVDGGYVKDVRYFSNNALANTYQYSSGVGIDFLTYYDSVMRVEYSYNKLRQGGIYFHFIAGI